MSDFSIEHGHAEYSDAELLEQARDNAQALILATVAFLQERGIPPAEWAAAIGETFARGWGDPRPWDAGEFLDAMLTNLRALGAEVKQAEFGVDHAEATTTGFPDPELCALFGIDPSHAAVFHCGRRDRCSPWSALDMGVGAERCHPVHRRAGRRGLSWWE